MTSEGTVYGRYRSVAGYPKEYSGLLPCVKALRVILGPWGRGYDLADLVRRCRISPGRYQIPPVMAPDELGAWLDESARLDD